MKVCQYCYVPCDVSYCSDCEKAMARAEKREDRDAMCGLILAKLGTFDPVFSADALIAALGYRVQEEAAP